MHSSASKAELASHDETPSSEGHDAKEAALQQADELADPSERDHFSPDEYQKTDRYKLVIPYQLIPGRDGQAPGEPRRIGPETAETTS